MLLHITKAKYIGDYSIWLSFNNGISGIVDLKDELVGDVFEPLKDVRQFKSFIIHPIMETIVWDNGADLAPEYLLSLIQSETRRVG